MSVHHHPAQALLMAYAAGSLDEAGSILVATHLALCPACRSTVGRLEALGGEVLEHSAPAPMGLDFARIAGRLDQISPEGAPRVAAARRGTVGSTALPRPLRDYLPADAHDIPWQPLARGVDYFDFATSGPSDARLLRVAAGAKMPHHGHAGTELTMVLSGGYQDVTGAYARGDVATADGALVHQPIADADEACICLTVTTGMLLPTRVLGVIGQIVHRLRA